ncbi:MAG: protein kinase [Thermoanaerobaculales bacterium]
MALQPGTRLGPYEILAPLGAGGMGEVYRGKDHKLDREVAIKVLPANLADNADALGRLEREAKAVAALSHPNILAVHDFGKIAGVTFAVMELLDGETLRERLSAGALSVRKAVDLGVQIAHGLAAAHEKGIVHRDLKPENIFLTRDGRAKILDFGLAKVGAIDAGSGRTLASPPVAATEVGTVLGTAGYMAPEQVRGLPSDPRSDIFSFGVILYEMLSGRRAFSGDSGAEIMTAILREEPPDLASSSRQFPPALERFVHHCLEKDPNQRFQSARDLAYGLEAISFDSGAAAPPPGATPRGWLHRLRLLALTAVVLVGVTFIIGAAFGRHGHVDPAPFPSTVRQLTFASGALSSPSLAPDGNTFVYVSDSAGNLDVFLQRVGGAKPINLTAGDQKDDTEPAFSPTGDEIAFRSERDGGGIFVMGATGENRRRLTDFGFQPTWSPDGKEIAVATEGVDDPLNRNTESELWAIDVASGAKRLVFLGDAVQPSWSPHGTRIAYWALPTGSGQRDIWTVPAAGEKAGPPVAVTNDQPIDWNPVWSHDGRYLYFTSDRGGSFNVWRIAIDEASGKVLGEPEAVTVPATTVGEFCLGRDGKTVAYQSSHYVSALEKIPFDPVAGKATGPGVPLFRSSVLQIDPDLSPDGSTLVMRSVGSKEDLFLLRTDGSGLRKLTDDAFRNRGPSWSPDGGRIGFYSNRAGQYELWSIRPDGSGLSRLMNSRIVSPWYPRWSPDGKLLSFGGQNLSFLLRMDKPPGQAEPEQLPSPGEGLSFVPFGWSPDGAFLAGTVGPSGGQSGMVAIYSLATHTYEKVADPGAQPKWLSDGHRLLYTDRGQVWLVDTRTKERHLAIASPPDEPINAYVAVSKDNRTIYAIRTLVQEDIWRATLATRQ